MRRVSYGVATFKDNGERMQGNSLFGYENVEEKHFIRWIISRMYQLYSVEKNMEPTCTFFVLKK